MLRYDISKMGGFTAFSGICEEKSRKSGLILFCYTLLKSRDGPYGLVQVSTNKYSKCLQFHHENWNKKNNLAILWPFSAQIFADISKIGTNKRLKFGSRHNPIQLPEKTLQKKENFKFWKSTPAQFNQQIVKNKSSMTLRTCSRQKFRSTS